jgi:hypothetical protein
MDPEQFAVFRHEAVHQLMQLNEECEKTFRISSWPRWKYDFGQGTLTFFKDDIPQVIASIQVIGTTSKSGGTWLWSWANQSLPATVTEAATRVYAFGQAEKLPQLTQESTPDDEYLGWEMAAIAASLVGSKGAYRCPGDNGFVYVVYSSLRFADEQALPDPEQTQIECSTHGTGFAAFICEHLAANPAQEWFSAEPDDNNKWPDAWCALCDAFFEEEGEWSEKNEAKLKIKVICHYCYEESRTRKKSRLRDR